MTSAGPALASAGEGGAGVPDTAYKPVGLSEQNMDALCAARACRAVPPSCGVTRPGPDPEAVRQVLQANVDANIIIC